MLRCSDGSMQMQMLLPPDLATCHHLVATADNDAWRQIMLIAWMMEGIEREYEFCDRLGSQSRMQNPEPGWLKACKLFEASGICGECSQMDALMDSVIGPANHTRIQPPRWTDSLDRIGSWSQLPLTAHASICLDPKVLHVALLSFLINLS